MDKGFVIWLTGLPGSGKTTISNALKPVLAEAGLRIESLDGDVVRRELSPELGFTKQDREIHARRVVYLAKLLARNGVVSIVSLISPYREFRSYARKEIGTFVEIFVKAKLETCMKRDPKGLYAKALAGQIKDLTGLQDTYEEPLTPELVVNTDELDLSQSVNAILHRLVALDYCDSKKFGNKLNELQIKETISAQK